jgi:hypothetical protein
MCAAFIVLTTVLFVHPAAAGQPAQRPEPTTVLSPYWNPRVRRWERIILEYSRDSGLDPDLVAAVIWKESMGYSLVRSPAGAVGLMQVMPREAGFAWRPTGKELEEPWRNVLWGTQALSMVILQGDGDLYNALAAYNGGWAQIHLHATRRYAEEVLAHYARAVAVHCGLPPEGYWVATVAALDDRSPGVLTVLGPQRAAARYSDRPVATCIPDATTDGRPTARAFAPPDGQGLSSGVGIWITMDGQVVYESPTP